MTTRKRKGSPACPSLVRQGADAKDGYEQQKENRTDAEPRTSRLQKRSDRFGDENAFPFRSHQSREMVLAGWKTLDVVRGRLGLAVGWRGAVAGWGLGGRGSAGAARGDVAEGRVCAGGARSYRGGLG